MNGFKNELSVLIKARYPVVYLVSFEERRVEKILSEICTAQKKSLIIWTATKGFTDFDGKVVQQGASDLTEALSQVIAEAKQKKVIYLFKDIHKWMDGNDKVFYRMLRDAVEVLKASQSTIMLLSPVLSYPREIEKEIAVLDVPYPDRSELKAVMDQFIQATKAVKEDIQLPTAEEEDTILRSGAGLTEDEFENIIAKSMVMFKKIDPRMVVAEKEQTIRKSGVLDFYQQLEGLENVGGLDSLKEWIMRRSLSFTEKARAFGLRAPRGIFLGGVTGCGKSLSVKAMASYMKMPLLMVDASKVLGSLVGQSEQNLRSILKTAEAVSPAILFIDEAEKMLPQGTQGDSGVSSRIFGMLLTWMQERPADKPVLVAMTANDPLKLPPELFNRFDATFFIDLPTTEERKAVWAIQIGKARRDPAKFDLDDLAQVSEGWSGREIEMIVSEALSRAFEAGKDIDTTILEEVLAGRKPLSVQRREDIEKMRKWGKELALPASKAVARKDEGRMVELDDRDQ